MTATEPGPISADPGPPATAGSGAAAQRPVAPPATGPRFSLGRRETQTLKYERVLFLTDAVFAIAMTLLVLDLRVPDDFSGGEVEAAVRRMLQVPGPILAFAIGFFVLAAYWTGHREIFGGVKRMNGRLIWLNFTFLFWIAMQPFATALLGSHDPTPSSVLAYALVQVATGGTQATLWLYATGHPEVSRPHPDPRFRRWVTLELLRVPIVGLVSVPVAVLAGPLPAMASWLLVVPVTLIVHYRFRVQVHEIPDD